MIKHLSLFVLDCVIMPTRVIRHWDRMKFNLDFEKKFYNGECSDWHPPLGVDYPDQIDSEK